jgi:6-phosphofructokinase 1
MAAAAGQKGVMVALRRMSEQAYRCETFTTPLETVARKERLLPEKWINASGNDVKEEFLDYVRPLVPDIPAYSHF